MPETSFYRRLRMWLARHPRLERALLLGRPLAQAARGVKSQLAHVWSVPRLGGLMWRTWRLQRTGAQRIPLKVPAPGSARIVMLACSYLAADPRIEREARALAAAGFRVKVICPAWEAESSGRLVVPDWGPGVTFAILPQAAASYRDAFPWVFSSELLEAALREEEAWAYHAHDLDTALPALAAAAAKGVLCVCDFHEWYSENVTYDERLGEYRPHSWPKRRIGQIVERLALCCASQVITVCGGIAQQLQRTGEPRRPVEVVRNIPPLDRAAALSPPAIDVRRTLNIPAHKAVLLYQGGVGPSRGLEPLIQAMGMVRHAVLVIRGPGIEHYQQSYLRLALAACAVDRVFCLPPVPSQRCVAEAQAAELGFWTLLPICKNFTYALPNKVFEYLAAGVPLVCAHHPEVAQIVEGFDVGRCFDPEDPRSIAAAVDELARDAELRRRCQANIPTALAELQAEREWAKLVSLYRRLGGLDQALTPASIKEAA
jgi:glycosyltransferase involved in cell wall biosynthesis